MLLLVVLVLWGLEWYRKECVSEKGVDEMSHCLRSKQHHDALGWGLLLLGAAGSGGERSEGVDWQVLNDGGG